MSDVELVIKIPEGIMEYVKNNGCLSVSYLDEIAEAIKNSTLLPKGHGRLIDADALVTKGNITKSYLSIFAPTIVEADTENDLPVQNRYPSRDDCR